MVSCSSFGFAAAVVGSHVDMVQVAVTVQDGQKLLSKLALACSCVQVFIEKLRN